MQTDCGSSSSGSRGHPSHWWAGQCQNGVWDMKPSKRDQGREDSGVCCLCNYVCPSTPCTPHLFWGCWWRRGPEVALTTLNEFRRVSEFLSPPPTSAPHWSAELAEGWRAHEGVENHFIPESSFWNISFPPNWHATVEKQRIREWGMGHKRPALEKRKREGTPGAGAVRGDGFAFQGRTKQIEVEKMYFRRICQKNLSQQSYSEPPASRPPSPQIM